MKLKFPPEPLGNHGGNRGQRRGPGTGKRKFPAPKPRTPHMGKVCVAFHLTTDELDAIDAAADLTDSQSRSAYVRNVVLTVSDKLLRDALKKSAKEAASND